MSNLSDLLPSGGGQNIVDFTASGTVASGKPVILNDNGTVTQVAISALPEALGTAVEFDSATIYYMMNVSDTSASKVVVFYRDGGNSNYATAIVGTISGTSVSFGSKVVLNAATIESMSGAYDSIQNKIVIAYRDGGDSDNLNCVVGTISGTSISFGAESEIASNNPSDQSMTFDSNAGKFVIFYKDTSDSGYGKCRVLTVSGDSVSAGTITVVESHSGFNVFQDGSCFDSSNNKVILTSSFNNGSAIRAYVGTISGTSISFGSFVTVHGSSGYYPVSCFDTTNNKVIIAYEDVAASGQGKAVVGTVSGTSMSVGSAATFETGSVYGLSTAFNTTEGKAAVVYRDEGNSNYGTYAIGTVSGTSISFATPVVYQAGSADQNSVSYNSTANRFFINYYTGSKAEGIVLRLAGNETNLTATNFIGLADAAISDTATGKINVKGSINSKQSSLTIGSDYYVQTDGSLNTATSAVNYDIANGSYTQAFSVSSQDTFPSGVAFNPAGTKMFVVGNTGDDVNEYTLSTGFDVSTASFVDSFSVSGQQAAPMSVAFNTDGTKMYIVGETEDTVAQYALSAGFDVSSASYTQAFDISGQETEAQGITFNTDGSKMFIVGDTGNDINEYTLSTGFDVSTASFVDSFSLASQTTQPKEGVFNSDGTELYVLARDNQKVYKYTLTTGFDVSTASYASVEFSVSSQETSPQGLAFSADGSKMYVCGDTGDDVNQYATTSTATNSTTTKVGQAVTATTINMMDLT